MMAMGCGAFVGDQLPPDGKIEEHVYHLIGNVYRQIEAKEPWCTRRALAKRYRGHDAGGIRAS